MGFFADTSDYGSASSISISPWHSSEWRAPAGVGSGAAAAGGGGLRTRTASYSDAVPSPSSREVAMHEFRLNGVDAPFEPEPRALLRQHSWPAPSPAPLLRPAPAPAAPAPAPAWPETAAWGADASTAAQLSALAALRALPPDALALLLQQLPQQRRPKRPANEGCRFCKNNGEREAVYLTHALRDAAGRVRCPVLRAYVCKRCGARDDRAHTIKYCPFSSEEERRQSDAMMRSVRMASGRRRALPRGHHENYYSSSAPSRGSGAHYYDSSPVTAPSTHAAPLDPVWAALEEKLLSSMN